MDLDLSEAAFRDFASFGCRCLNFRLTATYDEIQPVNSLHTSLRYTCVLGREVFDRKYLQEPNHDHSSARSPDAKLVSLS